MTDQEKKAELLATLKQLDRVKNAMAEMGHPETLLQVLTRLADTAERKPLKFKMGLKAL